MTSLYARLKNTRLHLVAPRFAGVDEPFTSVLVSPELSARLMAGVRALRDAHFGSLMPDGGAAPAYNPFDAACWHLIATDAGSSDVVGCIRLRVHDARREDVTVQSVLDCAGVAVPEGRAKEAIYSGVDGFMREALRQTATLAQCGGFAVAPDRLNSVLAPVLGVGAIALMRLLGLTHGLGVGTQRNRAADFYLQLGAEPLAHNGAVVPAFVCEYHGEVAKMLSLPPQRMGNGQAGTLADLMGLLATLPVLLPSAEPSVEVFEPAGGPVPPSVEPAHALP